MRFVILKTGEVIDTTKSPKKGYEYVVDDGILWVVPVDPNHTTSYFQTTSCGQVVDEVESLEEIKHLDFTTFKRWCREHGYKPYDANSLRIYFSR
jgi:hypothetical protein